MERKLLVLNGHPDPSPDRYCAALCEAYAWGARGAGWQCDVLTTGSFVLPVSFDDLSTDDIKALSAVAAQLDGSEGLAIVFPLWLDRPPATLRKLLDFIAIWRAQNGVVTSPQDLRSADIVVTMSMPAFIHRPRRFSALPTDRIPQPLSLAGIAPSSATFIGCVERISAAQRVDWLDAIAAQGGRAGERSGARPFLRRTILRAAAPQISL